MKAISQDQLEAFKAETKSRAASLAHGTTILNSIRPVANGLLQLEFIGSVKRESSSSRPQNILNSLMASHEKFQERAAFVQYAHLTATKEDLKATFPSIDVNALSTTDITDINMLLPEYSIQIIEQTEDKISPAKAAEYTQYNRWLKNKQTDAVVYSQEGFRVFRNVQVVKGQPEHLFTAKRREVNTVAAPVVAIAAELNDPA